MKETAFIEQRKKRWQRFEHLQRHEDSSAEELSELFAEISDDLSYAQTYYGKRTIRVYLNQLARSTHQLVYKQQKDKLSKFLDVWRISLPVSIYNARKELRLAFILSLIWIALGAISTAIYPDFPRIILGDNYVNMTLENIKKGNPLDVYTSDAQVKMFIDITLNNIRVAFLTFILGTAAGIGTHIFLFSNTIMLGAFQSFFALKGLLLTSFLGIWIHGAFEISSIVIAAGAGLTLGNSLLFPGTYTRMQSFTIGAKHGLKIMLSLVPFFIAAGFLESYVTHNYDILNAWSKWIIILLSFGLILFYFVIYPRVVIKKHPELEFAVPPKVKEKNQIIQPHKIRTFAELFTDLFSYYPLVLQKIKQPAIAQVVVPALVLLSFQLCFITDDLGFHYYIDITSLTHLILGTRLADTNDWIVYLLWSFVFAQYALLIHKAILKEDKIHEWKYKILQAWIVYLPLYISLTLFPWYFTLLSIFIYPFFSFLIPAQLSEIRTYSTASKDAFLFSSKDYGQLLAGIICLGLILVLFVQPIAFIGSSTRNSSVYQEPAYSDLLDYLSSFIHIVFQPLTEHYLKISNAVRIVVYLIFLFGFIPLFILYITLSFTSMREKYLSTQLRQILEKDLFKTQKQ